MIFNDIFALHRSNLAAAASIRNGEWASGGFDAGKVCCPGASRSLEAELLGMIAGGDYQGPGVSPDRADAMVWALMELMLGRERGTPRVRAL